MASQPRLDSSDSPIGRQVDDPSPLQVAHKRAVALATLPGEVVDANNTDRFGAHDGVRRCTTRSSVSLLTGTLLQASRVLP